MSEAQSTKVCSKCHVEKPLDAFNRQKRVKDGRQSRCRECSRTDNTSDEGRASKRRYRESEKGREKIRIYGRSEKTKEMASRYAKSDEGRLTLKRYISRNPQKMRARRTVREAVIRGKIPPVHTLKCSECGEQASHYHHHLGYEDEHRLSVVPTCASCHGKIHATE